MGIWVNDVFLANVAHIWMIWVRVLLAKLLYNCHGCGRWVRGGARRVGIAVPDVCPSGGPAEVIQLALLPTELVL